MLEFLIIIVVLIILAWVYRPFSFFETRFQRQKRKARFRMELIRMNGEADIEIQTKLIQMLDGDREAAERLVARQRFGKGGEYSENYYWSQAIKSVEMQKQSDEESLGA